MLRYPDPAKPKQMLDTLAEQAVMPYRHYYWPDTRIDAELEAELREVSRICQSTSLSAQWSKAEDADRAIDHIEYGGDGVKLSIQCSPWHYHENPPGKHDPRGWGQWATADLSRQRGYYENILRLLDGRAEVRHVYLDQERLRHRLYKYQWAERPDVQRALIEKNNAALDLVREYFPGAAIQWFDNGPNSPWHVWGEESLTWPVSGSLYNINELSGMFAQANEMHEDCSPPWDDPPNGPHWVANIGLGGFYERGVPTASLGWHGLPYKVAHDWTLGRALWVDYYRNNPDKYCDASLLKHGYFWPTPMSKRCGNIGETSRWLYHFLAYVAGSHNLQESEPIGTNETGWLDTETI